MQSSIIGLALVAAPVRCTALRFPVSGPAAPVAPTLATHQNMAYRMHGRVEYESTERAPATSCQADALLARHLSSLLRPSQGPTHGRRLCSCCMQAGGTESEVWPLLPQLSERPPGARYLLSSCSDAGTLIVTLPPVGPYHWFHAAWERASRSLCSSPDSFCLACFGLIFACFGPREVSLAMEAIFCCACAYGLEGAFTTSTLSIGDFQWEYNETIAGMSLLPICYRHGTTEELDICKQDTDEIKWYKMFLVAGPTKIYFNRNSLQTKDEIDWVYDSLEEQIAAISRRHKAAASQK